MSLLLIATGWDREGWRARLQAALPGMDVLCPGEPFDRRAVRYAAVWKHPPGSLAGLPALEAIFSLGAGVDHLMDDPRLPDVPIARVVDPDLTTRMSEYVLLHALSILRQQRLYDARQRGRLWLDEREQPSARQVRVGIMGLGELGQDAARKLMPVGFDVAGWSRTARQIPGLECHAGTGALPAFLARTDILVCLLPLTPDTTGIIDTGLLQKLGSDGRTHNALGGPHLINAGRGGLQVEADILAALDSGTLQSAVLDVFEVEPLEQSSPLWLHPRVSVTPHNAAMSAPDAIAALIARQVRRLQAGAAMDHVVDRTRGY